MERPFLDIIIPGYNPLANWQEEFIEQCKLLRALLPEYQLRYIFIDDGSDEHMEEDSFGALHAELDHFLFRRLDKNMGKGYENKR